MSNYDQYEQLRMNGAFAAPKPKRGRKKQKFSAAFLAMCVAASSACGFAGGAAANFFRPAENAPIYAAPQSGETYHVTTLAAATGNSASTIASTAAMVKQSVVEISTEKVTTNTMMRQLISEGAGSGVVVSADGYILTNHHVISGARTITVRLQNGQKHEAVLKGSDSKTDLALLKINASGLAPAVLGDSSKLVVGEFAIAIGNPLGELGGTVTSGIISALDREITIDGEPMFLLQTDASINRGNSGGGLFNIEGQLVGIVNAKSSGGDIEGIGFAIPINTVKPVFNDLQEYGYVRGRIDTGLTLVDISSVQVAMWYRVKELGLYVSKSENPQLQNGDRITDVGGKKVTYMSSFTTALNAYKVGDTVNITVDRGGRAVTVPVLLSEQKQ